MFKLKMLRLSGLAAAMLAAVSFSAFGQSQPITCDTALTAQDPLSAYVERATACLQPVGIMLERNTAQAIADADFVIAQDPSFAVAYAVRGQANLFSNRIGQGLADLSVALFLEPTNVEWLRWRSELMLFLNDVDGALADISRAVAVEPTSELLLLERSRIHERSADLASALADAEQAFALNPDSAAALLRIGDIHYTAGRDQAALDAYRQYLEIAAERSPLVNARVLILERRLSGN
ncbi:MAG: tetratricopeptide repeat protein [Aggregatilineales bacterium]